MGEFYNKLINMDDLKDTYGRKLYEEEYFEYLNKKYNLMVIPSVSNKPDLLVKNSCNHPVLKHSNVKYIDVKKINDEGLNYDLQCYSNAGSCVDNWLMGSLDASEIMIMYLRPERVVLISLEDYIDLVNVWYPSAEMNYIPFLSKTKQLERKGGRTKGSGTAYYLVYKNQIDSSLIFIGVEDGDVPMTLYKR